ncbi:MAG: twin-arginine translocase TatA/TatE family subunit [Roseitalea sp.]|jgi:sec-independent protein translocase protein TatA|uniref:Sec-independent protein translocase protein TatA n=1 Tax=Oceaniradius stylonematis TaxID=2184161 RepID=A0A3A8AEC5_9HYPH|nr:twin-arginine translocase TatA/TatE family subunit [Oceaniradius stylonematis]MBO6552528.1 twin-arginine translocase TatA/TatE family subunit [Roseitalea sp.]MBO6950552.1 twin-arginine translocase TatA/TatE family subunit [Rhizobiaceae bacterium]RNC94957.1 MAG: twin-arginine translocase TatA/TatE family subunit [Oricola sp.]MBO6591461.1 twin-arginine translocase TatA/TatE family subunit [Roseitalea sp.]MBO6599316.1 twin-arginine translocase TatA/TatE family subunit [Roseitalea sp.]
MGAFSIWQWIIVLVIVLLLFGRGKIPELMGDVAKGIRNFRKGMKDEIAEDEETPEEPARTVEHRSEESVKDVKDAVNKG